MGIVNKMIITAALLAIMFGWISITQAGGSVLVVDLDINYDGIAYECIVDIENLDEENVTVLVTVFVDNAKTGEENVSLNVTYFKGFRIKTHEIVVFELPCDKGSHNVRVHIHNDIEEQVHCGYEYEAQGGVNDEEDIDEEELEVEGDWLECP